tara:strand:+ start:2464 stop:2856 length:393 start_codon:yes stop_codon:yes gene_type:complete
MSEVMTKRKPFRMDYPSDKARLLDDQFHKGEVDFRVMKITPVGKEISFGPEGGGPAILERRYEVVLEFSYAYSSTRKDRLTLKVTWEKHLNGNSDKWKHSLNCTDVPTIWDQVRHNVEHDAKILEGVETA